MACSELRRLHILRQLCLEAMTEAEDDDERTDLERHVQFARYRAVLPELYFPVVQDEQFRAEMDAWKQQAEEEISGTG